VQATSELAVQPVVCADATIEKRLTTTRASTAPTNDMEFPLNELLTP
jgi:hypothetical protein